MHQGQGSKIKDIHKHAYVWYVWYVSIFWCHLLLEGEDRNEDEHIGDQGEEEDDGEDAKLCHLENMKPEF